MLFQPENLFYSPEHDWVCIKDNGTYCGIAPFKLTGIHSIDNIHLQALTPGNIIKQGQKILDLFYRDYQIPVYSPLTGVLKEVNPVLETGRWQQIIERPVGEGWIIRIAPVGINTRHLLQHTLYKGKFF